MLLWYALLVACSIGRVEEWYYFIFIRFCSSEKWQIRSLSGEVSAEKYLQ